MNAICSAFQLFFPLICAVQVPLEGPSTYPAPVEEIVIPLEQKLPAPQDSGFMVFPPLPGDLYAGNLIGSKEKDIFVVKTGDGNTTVSVVDLAAQRCWQASWTDSSISRNGRVIKRGVRDAFLGLDDEHLALIDIVDLDLRILLIDLPSSPLAVDIGDFNGDDAEDCVVLAETGLYLEILGGNGIHWSKLPSQESIYSDWLTSVSTTDRLDNAMSWPLVVDIRGQGLPDIVLPGMNAVAFYLHTGNSHLNLVEIPAPAGWVREETQYMEQRAPRMPFHVARTVRSFRTCDMVRYADHVYLVPFNPSGPSNAYQFVFTNEGVELNPSEIFTDPAQPIVLGDFVNASRFWLPWAVSTVQLLWPHTVYSKGITSFGDANEWAIDINNDHIEDRLSAITAMTTSGPKTTVLYRISHPDSGGEVEDWKTLSGPGWLTFKASSVVDLNGDGCLDLMFMKPRAPLTTILSHLDMMPSVECEYDAWLFDSTSNTFRRSRKHLFVIQRAFRAASVRPLVRSPFAGYLRAWKFINYGDLNDDGLTDIVMELSPKRLGVLYNNGSNDHAFSPDTVLEIKLPVFESYIVTQIGGVHCIIVWYDDGSVTIVVPDQQEGRH